MNTIRIAGKDYPCMITMGAMMRFKEQTGREVTEVKVESFSNALTLLWCCVASACKRDGVPFEMSLMEMADAITPEDFASWKGEAFEAAPVNPSEGATAKKKA